MARTLCEWSKKDIETDFKRLSGLVCNPAFVCKKCARSANTKKILCKPQPIAGQREGKHPFAGEKNT